VTELAFAAEALEEALVALAETVAEGVDLVDDREGGVAIAVGAVDVCGA
jgi:hypothetical protein